MVIDLYSKRNKKRKDRLKYHPISEKLRNQIFHIWKNYFLDLPQNLVDDYFKVIRKTIEAEHGLRELPDYAPPFQISTDYKRVKDYYFDLKDDNQLLDLIELIFTVISVVGNSPSALERSKRAVSELNIRFQENGFGYCFQDKKIVKVNSKFIHKEAIEPVFDLLENKEFSNAHEEYISAHDHFRHGRYKESINECLKAFESTMKIICAQKGWAYNSQKDTASKLIQICLNNNLIPTYLQNHFQGLKNTLESGVPTVRNKTSGHGQGSEKVEVPQYLASYTLHLTAVNIKLLIESYNALAN